MDSHLPHLNWVGLYGVRRIQFFSAQAPISPRSTGSPGAVLRPGARQYISHIASTNASTFAGSGAFTSAAGGLTIEPHLLCDSLCQIETWPDMC